MTYKPTIFPTLHGTTWAEVDLGNYAIKNFPSLNDNKLLDDKFCDQWDAALNKKSIHNQLFVTFYH